MSDIPEDIRKAAYDLGSAIRHHIAASEAELIEHDATIDDMIAMTIMAERKRCAEIANTVKPAETHNSYFHEGWDAASMTIASSIMGEEK